jgi:MFS transporter, MHS family, proline/betaine transporter
LSTIVAEGEAPRIEASNRQIASAVIASVLGWSLDLFDLFILLYVAPVVGAAFFPSSQPTLSLAAVYASFAVTLLMRPVGAAIFGSYADRFGRKRAMIVAVVGVGLATAAFGLLPTVAQIGVGAAAIFLLLRLVQGVFVGGVIASTHTIGTESVPASWRGVVSGLVGGGGAGFGALLASIAYFTTSSIFPGAAFAVWGWRCMFFSGIVSSFLGVFVFKSLEESPFWQELNRKQDERGHEAPVKSPVKSVLSGVHRPVLLVNLLITIGGGASYYLTSGFMPTFLKVVNKLPYGTSSLILIAASVIVIIAATLVGWISDKVGRKPTFLATGIVGIVALPLLYLAMAKTQDISTITLYALAIAFIGNAAYAPTMIFLNERFPTALRATGTGLSWNIGFAVGGTMPTFVSLASATPADIPAALAVFCVGVYLIYLIGAFAIQETRGNFT